MKECGTSQVERSFEEPISHAIDRIAMEEIGVKVSVLRHLGVIEYYEEDGRHTISNVYLAKIIDGKPRGSVQGKEIAFFKKVPKIVFLLKRNF